MFKQRRTILAGLAALIAAPLLAAAPTQAADIKTIGIDWAYYNPVSLVLKDKGWLEQEFAKDGIAIRWVFSAGSNKALEFLNARGIEFGSTAGAAVLLARVNGAPLKAVYVYSKPEWTALVTRPESGITKVEDLKGKRIAVTRGTDPYIFLLRALAAHKLSEKDVKIILLQHADGRTALEKGDVDAWAGLDPMMAQTELERGSKLFFRDANANTYGTLNIREDFAAEHPDLVVRVLKVYERARLYALDNPKELQKTLADAAKLSDTVAAKQLERTDLRYSAIGAPQKATILAAGKALQDSGVIPADKDVAKLVDELIDTRFSQQLGLRAAQAGDVKDAAKSVSR